MNIAIYSELIHGKEIYGVSARNSRGERFELTQPVFTDRTAADYERLHILAFVDFVTDEKIELLKFSMEEMRKNN